MSTSSSAGSGGLGFSGALFLVFLVLKLLGKITWSWLWVTSPLWGGVAIVLSVVLGFVAFAVIATAIDDLRRRRKAKP